MNKQATLASRWLAAGVLALTIAACGSDKKTESVAATTKPAATSASNAPTPTNAATPATTDATTDATTAVAPTDGGAAITLGASLWTGSAVNAWVAKAVIEENLGTAVTVTDLDENAIWPALAAGDVDAALEIWPSGHAADRTTYIDEQKAVVDIGLLGPVAKIGWYIPTFMLKDHPELATWEGFKDPAVAKLFATAETGAQGQFLMGDPSYVSFDEQIIKNLNLPLKFVVAGSEAAEVQAIKAAIADETPLLLQFWQPQWLQSLVDLTEVKLPAFTPECEASAAAADGKYNCDYPVDNLYKAASAKLEKKNPAVLAMLKKFSLTTDQQNEISAMVDNDGMEVADAAKKWIADNPDVVKGWLA